MKTITYPLPQNKPPKVSNIPQVHVISSLMGIKSHLFPKKKFPFVVLNIPRHQKNKNQSKFKKKVTQDCENLRHHRGYALKKKDGMHRSARVPWCLVLICRDKRKSRGAESLFVDPEWLLSSCAATDGDGRVGPACPCRVCASSWWFGCSVSVSVCVL